MSAQVLPFASCADGIDDASDLFDEAIDLFAHRPAAEAMARLVQGLQGLRRNLDATAWQAVKSNWMHHPLARIIHQDPLTSWAYRKPRGYPCDARLLDFIHGEACVAPEIAAATELGRAIYACTSRSAVAAGLCERPHIVADCVDRIARKAAGRISVLSLSAGHLREAACSQGLAEGRIARWVAFDHDRENQAVLQDRFAGSAVEVFDGTPRGLVNDRYQFDGFDLISAVGLYDHFDTAFAQRLTAVAFRMLKPGGTLLFSNVARGIETDGYMETFMGWPVIDRDEDAMTEIWSDLPAEEIAVRRLFADGNQAMIYALVQRI